MSDPNRALSEVPALLEERRKYEAWIAALEARRESTQPHVYQRVHEDYRGRLKRVEDQLATFRDALEADRARITTRLEQIRREEESRHDERDELDLRVQVGELSAAEAAKALQSLDETLLSFVTERERLEAQLAALSKLVSGQGTSGQATSSPGAAREPRPSTPGGSFDELAFLSSVVPSEKPRADAAPPPVAPPPTTVAPAAQIPVTAPRGGTTAPAPDLTNIQDRDLEALAPREEGGASLLTGITGSAPTATHESTASEALLRDLTSGSASHRTETPPLAGKRQAPGAAPLTTRPTATADQPKTLKCTECGAMNYPTEWYCERCGAELAAL